MAALSLRSLWTVFSRFRSINFSQYGEDALLPLLGSTDTGFYVDVGAYHPWRESNTYKLYLKGWDGLTIEPNVDAAPAFRKYRPRDTHPVMGVAKAERVLTYHRYEDPKFNTFEPDAYRETLTSGGPPIEVPCRPLSAIVEEYAGGRKVDLLSVDCEGLDLEVLQSLDWSKTRPSVVIAEDLDQFHNLRDGGGKSETVKFLSEQGYGSVGQAMFSFLYLDRSVMLAPAKSVGFNLSGSQAVI